MLNQIKNKLVVSCQALPDEPLHSSFIMGRMALAAKQGGAAGIRAQSKEDILEIRRVVDLPVIGIVKRNYPDSEIYITPTRKEADELIETGCEMVALDATQRARPNGESLQDLIAYLHENRVLVMADCSTLEECVQADRMGADCVSTTLCGYTPYSEKVDGPNFSLIRSVLASVHVPVIAEGRINTPAELRRVMDLGVHSAVVGSAITRPRDITARFARALAD